MNIPKHLKHFLSQLSSNLEEALGSNLTGVYVHGSISYGGYVKERSDTDILVIINERADDAMIESITSVLKGLSGEFPEEIENLEFDVLLLSDIAKKVPVLHSQYTYYENKPISGEKLDGFWIELANTRENGITLYGPEPATVIPEIDKSVLIEANREKFNKLKEKAPGWEKQDLWNQTYILVQSSRFLYSLQNDLKLISKQDALSWARDNAPEQFSEMLEVAMEKIDDWEGPREKIISDNWEEYFRYVESYL